MDKITPGDAEALLDAIAELEGRLSVFYAGLAVRYPEDTIWARLAGEESHHAELALQMKALIGGLSSVRCDKRLKLAAVRSMINYVDQQIQRQDRGDLPRKNALFIARDIEHSLIEKDFHNAFDFPDPRYAQAAAVISQQTRRHLQGLEEFIGREFPNTD